MKIKLCFICSVIMLFNMLITVVSAEPAQLYGFDNLNNNPGNLIIGFLGGSITQGAGASQTSKRYSTQIVDRYFKTKYPNKTITELNAGIGGTPSDFGLFRVRKDLKLGTDQSPDVVFVEFAVNDCGSASTEADRMGLSARMEGIVRQMMDLPKQPVIIFLYTSCDKVTQVYNAISAHEAVAQHYGIGSVNMHKYVRDGVDKGDFVWTVGAPNTLTVDGTHPNDAGYTVYTDYMIKCFEENQSKYFKKLTVPEVPYSDYVYGKTESILYNDPNVTFSDGWNVNHAVLQQPFPDGVMETANGVGKTIQLKFTGRSLGIAFSRTTNGGYLDYVVKDKSGNQVKNGTLSLYYPSGAMAVGYMAFIGIPYGEYTVTFTGRENLSAQGSGTYLSIAYFMAETDLPVFAPSADNVVTEGTGSIGKLMKGTYTFNNKNVYTENGTTLGWYVSDSVGGTYSKIADGAEFTPAAADEGKYIKFGVQPKNSIALSGVLYYSEPVLVTKPDISESVNVSTAPTFKVGGVLKTDLSSGNGTYSLGLRNSGTYSYNVALFVPHYIIENGVKKMTGVDMASQLIGGGQNATLSTDVNIAGGETIKPLLVGANNIEPMSIPALRIQNIVYEGSDKDGADIYNIYDFN